jgi:hypothetical protein
MCVAKAIYHRREIRCPVMQEFFGIINEEGENSFDLMTAKKGQLSK